MDGLVKRIMEMTNMDESKATEIVTIVRNFLAEKLPPRLLKKVEGALENDIVDDAKGAFGKAKDLLGKK